MTADAAVVVLAGGAARRFPGKLEARIDGTPMLLHTYARLRGRWPVCVVGRSSFAPAIDAALDCPLIVDRWPARGPLGGLLSACGVRREPLLFGIAADMPGVDAALLAALFEARADAEAIVPECDGRMHPLAALYRRSAVVREGFELLRGADRSMHALLRRLRVRTIPCEPHQVRNVNSRYDLEVSA